MPCVAIGGLALREREVARRAYAADEENVGTR
jgi:hypothetical protein